MAGIDCREGPKKQKLEVMPGAVSSGPKKPAYRRGGCRSQRNMSQLIGAYNTMTLELVVLAEKRARCRW